MRRGLRIAFGGLIVLAAVVLAVSMPKGVDTDVYALLGSDAGTLSALARKTASTVRVLCDTPALAARCREAAAFDPPVDPKALYELVRTHGKGLLADRQRALLAAGETNRIARSARRRDYSGLGLFPKQDDPHYFLSDFVLSLRPLQPQLPVGAELLTGSTERWQDDAAARLVALARAESGVHLSGAPFHTLLATKSSKHEINVLGAVSLLAVLLIGFALFRNVRFLLPLALTLAAGFLAGSAAVFALPGRPHVLTFLFGTSLIGLGVDYCYHGLARRAEGPDFVRSLTGALATSGLSFLPLLFSSVGILNQMAVFTVAGLVTIYAAVLLFGPAGDGALPPKRGGPNLRMAPLPRCLFFLLAAAGCLFLRLENDLSKFHRMDPVMAAGEAAVAQATGFEKLHFQLLDLEAWQHENAALKAKMGVEPSGEFLRAADLPAWMTLERNGRTFILWPSEQGLDVKSELASLFDRFASETYRLLAIAFAILTVVMAIVFRRRFFAYVAPVAAAVVSTAGVIGWLGEPLNFFQLLCFFILIGLGVDYAIFHRSDASAGTASVVRASFLTSLVGFGALAFTSFQVTRSMGITLGVGLFFAYLYSLPRTMPSRGPAAASPADWSARPEQSAGRGRILFLWYVYRVFGKTAAKALTACVVTCVYPFAAAARAAIRANGRQAGCPVSPFSVMLNFAWSLLDKTDACTLKRDLPALTVTGDDGWRKGGCFLLSTHVGCIEVLPALRQVERRNGSGARPAAPRVHAFQQLTHDAVFTEFFLKYLDPDQLTLHAVEDVGVETAVEMQAAVGRGEIVLMAGDRLSAATATSAGRSRALVRTFCGRECAFPKGVFRFAALMECPVYAIACVRTAWNAYEVNARRLGPDLLEDYVLFLEQAVRQHPKQWYQFHALWQAQA